MDPLYSVQDSLAHYAPGTFVLRPVAHVYIQSGLRTEFVNVGVDSW